jgi:hypothetical protein
VPTLAQITYEAGRSALADQESFVAGILQRTGTLLAAHALVASFLGANVIQARGLHPAAWIALSALALGLLAAVVLLGPWQLPFSINARELYDLLSDGMRDPADDVWLATAGYLYQDLRERNTGKIRLMSGLSATLSVLTIVQTLAWLAALAVE